MFARESTIEQLGCLVLCSVLLFATNVATAQAQGSAQLAPPLRTSVAWNDSRLIGTPDKPLPLSIEPAFEHLKFNDPMHVRWQADTQRYFVCELGGKLWSFPHEPDVRQADLVVDLQAAIKSFDPERCRGVDNVYSLVFDPNFKENRFVYVCMILGTKSGPPLEDGTRISRFEVSRTEPPTIDVQSELPIISWLVGGHNGCDMAFDNTGCLLISSGDATAPAPPDELNTGQDCSDLLASILRIDVRHATQDQPYQIPSDNPFLDRAGVRPEIWAFGFRNPWRISVDPRSGELWLGDVGWEKWEMVHRVVRGGNYGWSIREGFELLRPEVEVGPSPVLPPRLAISHADSASITGGFVYRGTRLQAIADQYLFGDWTNGRIWAVPLDDHSPHTEVASGQLRIIAFEPDRDGEPLIVNHLGNTTLFRLATNENYDAERLTSLKFPRKLSETGLFADVAQQQPATGVIPFGINQPLWQDGAVGSHFLALPGQESVTVYDTPQPVDVLAMFNSRLHYPPGSVLAKTLTMPANPEKQRRSDVKLETQVLHFDGRLWHGYSYRWNEQQTDAELVEAAGTEFVLPGSDGQRWRIHSRTECIQCHNPWPETTLAFTPEQLHQPERGNESNWLKMVASGFVVTKQFDGQEIAPEACVRQPLVNKGEQVALRARSYLHANCAHCHQNGAGSGVMLSLRMQDQVAEMFAIDQRPTKGDFGILNSRIIAQGAPTTSALVYRMASSSAGHMPHIGAHEVDFEGLTLISNWIEQMRENAAQAEPVDSALVNDRGATLLEAIATASNEDTPEKRSQRLQDALQLAIDLAELRTNDEDAGRAYDSPAWIAELARSSDALIASLFEAHLLTHQRQRRLSPGAVFADVSGLTGDAARGQAYFFDKSRSQCATCHRVGEAGGQVGPALDGLGLRQTPAQIFESLVDPSRVIEPRYQSHVVLTVDGRGLTGLLAESSDQHLVLINAQGERLTIPVEDIEMQQTSSVSLMPGGLAAGMTAQQMADLLAYLSDLQSTADTKH